MNNLVPHKQILEFLNETIAQFKNEPNHKLPSERMLADKFKASRRSVRIAYDKLIEKNLVAKVHGKGYFTLEKVAADTPQSSVKEIHLIIPSIKASFSHSILLGIADFCEENSLELVIKLSKNNPSVESKYINNALKSNAKGIILFPIDNELRNNDIVKLSERRYPFTIIDRYFKNINASFVSTDNYNMMFNAMKFLRSRKFKDVVFLSTSASLATTVEDRLNGFIDGYKAHYDKDPADALLMIENFLPTQIYDAIDNYLDTHPLPQLIIAPGAQHIADSIEFTLNRRGVQWQKNLRFMFIDDNISQESIDRLKPYIIKQRAYQIGYESAMLLYNQIYGDLRTESKLFPADIYDLSKPTRHFKA